MHTTLNASYDHLVFLFWFLEGMFSHSLLRLQLFTGIFLNNLCCVLLHFFIFFCGMNPFGMISTHDKYSPLIKIRCIMRYKLKGVSSSFANSAFWPRYHKKGTFPVCHRPTLFNAWKCTERFRKLFSRCSPYPKSLTLAFLALYRCPLIWENIPQMSMGWVPYDY